MLPQLTLHSLTGRLETPQSIVCREHRWRSLILILIPIPVLVLTQLRISIPLNRRFIDQRWGSKSVKTIIQTIQLGPVFIVVFVLFRLVIIVVQLKHGARLDIAKGIEIAQTRRTRCSIGRSGARAASGGRLGWGKEHPLC